MLAILECMLWGEERLRIVTYLFLYSNEVSHDVAVYKKVFTTLNKNLLCRVGPTVFSGCRQAALVVIFCVTIISA
jgi:hypothetical protein